MKLAVLVLCFMGLYCVAEACRCRLKPKKQLYCNSDFVFKVKFMQEFDDFYKIKVLRSYKNKNMNSVKIHPLGYRYGRLYTQNSAAACGVSLEQGKEYIVSGFVKDKIRYVDSCISWKESPITNSSLNLIRRLKRRPSLCNIISTRG